MMVIVGTLSFNFAVLLPLLADDTWQGTATTYALLTAAMGAGSVVGALAVGARGRVGPALLVLAALGFGVVELLAAGAPTLAVQVAVLVPLGAVTVVFASGVSSSLQLNVAPAMRGRVMALYSMVFIGSTPLGAPLVGWLADVAGPRAGLVLGAVAALAARRSRWWRSAAPVSSARQPAARGGVEPFDGVAQHRPGAASGGGRRRLEGMPRVVVAIAGRTSRSPAARASSGSTPGCHDSRGASQPKGSPASARRRRRRGRRAGARSPGDVAHGHSLLGDPVHHRAGSRNRRTAISRSWSRTSLGQLKRVAAAG